MLYRCAAPVNSKADSRLQADRIDKPSLAEYHGSLAREEMIAIAGS
jgi:hypothetical protein